jgi:hypothetical protein
MSHETIPTLPRNTITQEQLDAISGGECTITDVVKVLEDLKDTYESLIDFTSYVIERVVGP